MRIIILKQSELMTNHWRGGGQAKFRKSGYLGAPTYIIGLVVLTADHTLAVGPSEEQTH